ncbi:STAS domain-containing protein [Nitrosospira multiformis]|uniref:Phospholipid transport system transporter-binding protein n=1 Tax=Nitrosospira multiformis TaxID=1231 RepID=A0A1I7HKL8_9PROT|nr:STAS domain-containing protein [Nitrosospira multiformis]SFU61225.1 phospholipid transport system transporter-binding protein [Nitrosospira multiformis]
MTADVIRREDGELSVEGSITIDNVVSVIASGVALFDGEDVTIDLGRVTEADSAAVSLLLEWRREAARRRLQIRFLNMPQNLQSLMQLYGVSELMSGA